MKRKLGGITLLAACMIMAVAFFTDFYADDMETYRREAAYLLDLNEIQKLGEQGEYEKQQKKLEMLQEDMRVQKELPVSGADGDRGTAGKMVVICLVFLFFMSGYVYIAILRPFEKMKKFAGEIAKGNFDIPLRYERSNYFGEFTWSFDCMRREIVKARSCEREAIENNKTVIATLSHDIKTPIARAVIHTPKLLFADEPTGALNRRNTTEVLNLLTELNGEGQSILMVTHDMRAALRATRLLYLSDGKITGELMLPPYEQEEEKSREVQVNAWLSSMEW